LKILVVSQYFWPENFRINDLCLAMQERGHEITVLTGQPNYPDGNIFENYLKNPNMFSSFNGIPIIRAPILSRKKGGINLLLNYFSFLFSASFVGAKKLKNQEFDVIFVCQLSPVTSAIPAILLKFLKKKPIVMWSLDLWPDSLESVGAIKSKMALNLVGYLVSWIYKQCDVILGQSDSYLEAVKNRCTSEKKLVLFPNWAEDQFKIENVALNKLKTFNILFAGNIGDAQDFESIISCAELLKLNNINVIFSIVGSGSKFDWLQSEIINKELACFFVLHGMHPLESMPNFYSKADAALVSLKACDIFERTIPGKIQSYMLAALPIVAMIDGEGRHLVDKACCGFSGGASDEVQLFENIKTIINLSPEKLRILGDNGRLYASKEFNKEKLMIRLENVLNDITKTK